MPHTKMSHVSGMSRTHMCLSQNAHHNELGFILQQLTPIAHEWAEMPHDEQDELHHRLLRCGIRAQGPSIGLRRPRLQNHK